MSAQVALQGVPNPTAAPPLLIAVENAIAVVAETGRGSVRNVEVLQSRRFSTLIFFLVAVPWNTTEQRVRYAVQEAGSGSLDAPLTEELHHLGVSYASNVSTQSMDILAVHPAVPWGTDVYQCPYPQNCRASQNGSCTEGATGVVCAQCQPGWTLGLHGCRACTAFESSPEAPIVHACLAVAFLAVLVLAAGLMQQCAASAPHDENSLTGLGIRERLRNIAAEKLRARIAKQEQQAEQEQQREQDSDEDEEGEDGVEMKGTGTAGENTTTAAAGPAGQSSVGGPGHEESHEEEDEEEEEEEDEEDEELNEALANVYGEQSLDQRDSEKAAQLEEIADRLKLEPLGLDIEDGEEAVQSAGHTASEVKAMLSKHTNQMSNQAAHMLNAAQTPVKVLIGFLQIQGSFMDNLEVPWPGSIKIYLEWGAFLNLDAFHVVGFGCMSAHGMLQFTYLHLFALSAITPIVLMIANFSVMTFRTAAADTMAKKDKIRILHMKMWLFFLFVLYPGISRAILQLYRCRAIGDKWYLSVDVRVECYTEQWGDYAIAGAVAALLYPIGILLGSSSC